MASVFSRIGRGASRASSTFERHLYIFESVCHFCFYRLKLGVQFLLMFCFCLTMIGVFGSESVVFMGFWEATFLSVVGGLSDDCQ